MLKNKFFPLDLIFDIETVPDLATARRVFPDLDKIAGNRDDCNPDVLGALYALAGATAEDPKPFLKYFLHRVVSIAGIWRKHVATSKEHPSGIELSFFSLPGEDLTQPEKTIVRSFLKRIGSDKPRVVGWASSIFDLPCLSQRALINGLTLPAFCERPDKPWEGVDYFAKGSDHNVDLLNVISSNSPKSKATLNEFARALRIPGKLGVEGSDVAQMYCEGKLAEIVAYNECDTASTYLVWLEVLRMTGQIDGDGYEIEKNMFEKILVTRAEAGAAHFELFLTDWKELQKA